MPKINIKINTSLLKPGEWNKAIKKAQFNVREKGLKKLQSYTPIDTGLMIKSWKVQGENLGIRISNTTEYSSYVDEGTRFMSPRNITSRTIPYLLDEYENEILNQIDKID